MASFSKVRTHLRDHIIVPQHIRELLSLRVDHPPALSRSIFFEIRVHWRQPMVLSIISPAKQCRTERPIDREGVAVSKLFRSEGSQFSNSLQEGCHSFLDFFPLNFEKKIVGGRIVSWCYFVPCSSKSVRGHNSQL